MAEQSRVVDPIRFAQLCWPNVRFYREQVAVIRSVVENDETFVVAGNMLGKDFVTGFIVLWFFMAHKTCRVVTTSVKDDHLRVLWGEIGRFIRESKYPLTVEGGGPLICLQREIRKRVGQEVCPISYVRGCVSQKGEGLTGHHAPNTLLVIDEASGVEDSVYEHGMTWAKKVLVIGNPNPCVNFFYNKVKRGSVKAVRGDRYRTRVLKIRAEDSPNVRLGMAEERAGMEPSGKTIVPGVLSYHEYLERRASWPKIRQSIGLDAEFWEGSEVLLYPPEWLLNAGRIAERMGRRRTGKTMGVDPAAGGDSTCYAVCDDMGLVYMESVKTPDTSVVTGRTIALMMEYKIDPENVLFDVGGGGQQHADRLRAQGYDVRTVGFGEGASPMPTPWRLTFQSRVRQSEIRYAFQNKRAEMYWYLRLKLDPHENPSGFGIPFEYEELRRQMSLIPLQYDGEGRMRLPPKHRRDANRPDDCLYDILGCSPDELDALVLAVYGLCQPADVKLGVF